MSPPRSASGAHVLLERTDQLSALADAYDAVIAARAGAVLVTRRGRPTVT